MAITAIVGDTSSVGSVFLSQPVVSFNGQRRNPQLATARIRTVVAPHIVSDAVGGWISADFTIPSHEALRWKPVLRYGAATWLFDGLTPIFYGWAEQPVWTQTGDCQMTISGPWALLGQSRMREAWELWDMSLLTKGTGTNENKAGSVNLNSDGTLTLSIPAGTIQPSDRCSVDYLLFGEAADADDDKAITAFEFDISDSQNFAATRRVRVIGKANAAGATGDLLYDTTSGGSSGRQGACNLHGANQGGVQWPNTSGYRCLRFEIINTAGAPAAIAADWYATFDRIRIGTREQLFPAAAGTMDTAAIARDIFLSKIGTTPDEAKDTPQEFWANDTSFLTADDNTRQYDWGLDPRIGTGSAPNSGVGITGFNALEWQTPADIIAALAAIDGNHVGFYQPYNARGGYDAPGNLFGPGGNPDVGSSWLTAPPQLYYQPFTDPNQTPDYIIYTRQGAQLTLSAEAQPLADMEYVNYQTLRGRQLSAVVTDTSTQNYLYAQGFRRADDYTLQPAVGDVNQASALGEQNLSTRRQPLTAGTITIANDGSTRTPILKGGATIPHLASIRPGSVRIADVLASSGLKTGYATHVEWWGTTLDSNEHVELTLATPGQMGFQRALARQGLRANRQRVRIL